MAVFRVQMPDGRVARIEAADGYAALAFAKGGLKAGPSPAKKDYDTELAKARQRTALGRKMDAGNPWFLGGEAGAELTRAPALPLLDEVNAGLRAAGNDVWNATYRRAKGEQPVDSQAIALANMRADAEDAASREKAHPVATRVGGLLSGLVGGAGGGAEKLIVKGAGMLPRAAAIGKAAGVGAGYGGAYGLLEGQDWGERAANAKTGAASGAALGGFLEGVGAPLAQAGIGLAKDVVRGARKALAKPTTGPVVATPEELRAAALAATRLAQKKGLTSSAVAAKAAPYAGKDPMAAELIGPEGVTQLAATARRGGKTGDTVRARVRSRQLAAPERIQGDFKDILGVSPEAAAGDIEAMIEQGQAAASPLFKTALAGEHGVWNPQLEALSQRPSVRKALEEARLDALDRGESWEGLHMGRVEVPHPGMGDLPPEFGGQAVPLKPRRGPAEAPSQGKTLNQFVAENGGLHDAGGDLAAVGLDRWHVGRPYQRPLISEGGGGLDDMAVRAWERGYFPGREAPPTDEELFHAMSDELRGRPTFAREADEAAAQRHLGREADEEAIYRGHAGEEPPEAGQYTGSPAPEYEPAYQTAPRAATWDKVRKTLNELIEKGPDGRPINTGEIGRRNQRYLRVAGEVRDALAGREGRAGALPQEYGQALNVSGDYMSVRGAFDRVKGRLTNGTMREFGKVWSALKTDAEKNAARSALASDVMDLWGRGQLKGGKFALPGIQQKLELAFGKTEAAKFVQRMEAEAELAASGSRAAPYSGSPTMGLGEAAAEQNAAIMPMTDLQRIGGKLFGGKPFAAAGDALGTIGARTISYGRTQGMNEAMRDEYGRILQMEPAEFARFLRKWETLPEAVKRRFPLPAGLIGGNVAGQAQRRRLAPEPGE